MATKEELKEIFSTGKKPTGDDFASLVDESVQDLSEFYKKGEVDAGFQVKGSYATTTQVEAKADKSYVDTELGKKANAASLTGKADKTVVDALVTRIEALEGAGG